MIRASPTWALKMPAKVWTELSERTFVIQCDTPSVRGHVHLSKIQTQTRGRFLGVWTATTYTSVTLIPHKNISCAATPPLLVSHSCRPRVDATGHWSCHWSGASVKSATCMPRPCLCACSMPGRRDRTGQDDYLQHSNWLPVCPPTGIK